MRPIRRDSRTTLENAVDFGDGFLVGETKSYCLEQGVCHNSPHLRTNREARDRGKTFQGLEKHDSAFFKGYLIYHNFDRPHEGLDGDTHADRVGIKVERE